MVKEQLTRTITDALRVAKDAGDLPLAEVPDVSLETPPSKQFGDFSSNVAMVLARQVQRPAREVADQILRHLVADGELIERVEVAGAGFLNFFLRPDWLHDTLRRIHQEGERYGRSDLGEGRRLQVEFVSANPTGPLSVPHGRAAAIGDVVASLLDWIGYRVAREFYINDAGGQVQRFGKSVEARYLQLLGHEVAVPDDGYQGEYVIDLARQILERDGEGYAALEEAERSATFARLGRAEMLREQQETLRNFGVHFDVWYSESSLHESGKVTEVIELLRERGHVYESEGAVWLRSSAFGDDKDRPLVRSNGEPTYIAADLAYHRDKFLRGFDKVVDIWGPDHHGYIARTKAGIQALGFRPDQLDILIYQYVRLFLGGELRLGSRRAGDIIPVDEVVAEVGRDTARYFYLMRTGSSPLDFDLDLARKQADDNPVYYVQYAHARICGILREAEERGVPVPRAQDTDLSRLQSDPERGLIRKLLDFPAEVREAALAYEPYRLTRFAQELAATFHSFYRDCWVLGQDAAVTAARLVLVDCTRLVLRNVFAILGVSAPDRMERRAEVS